jgi:hypothetical protein
MHGILSGVLTAGLLATAAAVAIGQGDAAGTQDAPIESATAMQAESVSYRLLVGATRSCLIETATDSTAGRLEVTTEPKCPTLYPPLAEVRHWREKDKGTVELTRADGTIVLELAVSDGFAYETFRPDAPLISLVALAH